MHTHEPDGYDCPFCRMQRGHFNEHNQPEDVVAVTEHAFARVSPTWWPANPGGALVVPREHHENLYDLPAEVGHAVWDLTQQVAGRCARRTAATASPRASTTSRRATRTCGTSTCTCCRATTATGSTSATRSARGSRPRCADRTRSGSPGRSACPGHSVRQARRMDFQHMQERARAVRARYAEVEASEYGRSWTTEEIMLGFLGDVGDLAKLVQGKPGAPARGPRRGPGPRARRLPVERAHPRRRLRRGPRRRSPPRWTSSRRSWPTTEPQPRARPPGVLRACTPPRASSRRCCSPSP